MRRVTRKLVRAIVARAGYRLVPALPEHDLRLMDLVTALRRMEDSGTLFEQLLDFALPRHSQSQAQLMQDLFVDFVLQKTEGTFVEFGAYDGVTFSNSIYLERHRAWRGVLAEPTPRLQQSIDEQRPLATLEKRCVYSRTGATLEFLETKRGELSTITGLAESDHMSQYRCPVKVHRVTTVSLDDLIKTHFGEREIDYVSIDTEGSEWEIISSYKFSGRPAIFTIEHNFTANRDLVLRRMQAHGYVNVFPSLTGFDDWFVRKDVWEERFSS